MNIRQSLSMTLDAHTPLQTMILDPHQTLEVPNAPQRLLKQKFITKGVLDISSSQDSTSMAHDTISVPQQQPSNSLQIHNQLNALSHKWTLASLPTPIQTNPKKRKLRTCKKCGNAMEEKR